MDVAVAQPAPHLARWPGVRTLSRRQSLSALAAGAVVLGGGLALVFGLSFASVPDTPRTVADAMMPTRNTPEPTPSPSTKPSASNSAKAAPVMPPAPAAPKADTAPVLAIPPVLPPVPSPSQPAAKQTGTGPAARPGAANRDGEGQGADGTGNRNGGGTGGGGSGGSGYGSGADNANLAAYPRQTAGKLHYSEIPKALRQAHAGGVIRLTYRIGTDGRVSGCRVLQSSGYPDFDAETCAAITARFRFKPARDRQGHTVPFAMIETHGWDD